MFQLATICHSLNKRVRRRFLGQKVQIIDLHQTNKTRGGRLLKLLKLVSGRQQNSQRKSIFTQKCKENSRCRDPNSCVTSRKSHKEKASVCEGAWSLDSESMEMGHIIYWVHIYPVSEWRGGHQGKMRGRESAAPITPGACSTILWGRRYDLLVRSRLSNVVSDKHMVSWVHECSECPGFWSCGS